MDSSDRNVVPQQSRSTVVVVVGIAAAVLSSFQLINSWLSLFMLSLYGIPSKEPMGRDVGYNILAFIVTHFVVVGIINTIFQAACLITSIGVLQRRRWARPSLIVLLSILMTVIGVALVSYQYERDSGDAVFVFFVSALILLGYIIYRFQSDQIKHEFDQAANPSNRSRETRLIAIVVAVTTIVTLFILGRLYLAPPSGVVGRFDVQNESEAMQSGCYVGRYSLVAPRAEFPDGDAIDTVYAWVSSKPATLLSRRARSSNGQSLVFVLHGECKDAEHVPTFPSWWYSSFVDPDTLLQHLDGTPGFDLTVVQLPDTLRMRIKRTNFDPGSLDDNVSDSIDVALVKTF
jgi:uncharacterized membrane protein YjjB (DUF3815 family)